MLGQDIALLLKVTLLTGPRILSKQLAKELFISEADISNSLRRCKNSGLLYWSDLEKRVNRPGLTEFLVHGLRYAFPPERGGPTRGIPTGVAAVPLKEHFLDTQELAPVWPFAEGNVRGLSFSPLYKYAPQAAMSDSRLYELLALCDAIRGGRVRERAMASNYLRKILDA